MTREEQLKTRYKQLFGIGVVLFDVRVDVLSQGSEGNGLEDLIARMNAPTQLNPPHVGRRARLAVDD